MKNKENKQIAEKLDSLHTLPEGYHPDIESKWALLEEAIGEKVVICWRIHLKWWAVAASILLICTLAVWLDNRHGETKGEIVENGFSEKKIYKPSIFPTEEEGASADRDTQALPAKVALEAATNKTQIKNKLPKPLPLNENVEMDPNKLNNSPVDQTSSSISEIAIVQPDKKRNKQRYIEMDFSEPSQNIQLSRDEKIFAHLFRFKIIPDETLPYTASNSENNFLKFKKNF